MIFVTVGGMHGFERLVREMDRIAGELDERIVMQIGATDCEPRNCEYFRFAPKEEVDRLHSDARVTVSHAGIGTILAALEHHKPIIIMPRMKKYGEAIDDHQLEIAREMQAQGLPVVCDVANLAAALTNAGTDPVHLRGEGNLPRRLKDYLDSLDEQLKKR